MTGAVLTRAQRIRAFASITVGISIVGIQIGLIIPLLTLVLEAQGVPSDLIGYSAAFGTISIALCAPFVPAATRRFGVIRLMLCCYALGVATVLLLKLFDNVWAWFPLRFLFNASMVGLFVSTEAWIGAIADDRTRGRVVGVYASALGLGLAIGPGILAITGSAGWTPFLWAAALIALGAVPLLFVGGNAPVLEQSPKVSALGFLKIAPTLSVAVALFGLLETGTYALMPVYGLRHGLDERLAAGAVSAFALGAIALQVPLGWLADRTNRYLVLIGCGVASLLGALALPALAGSTVAYFSLLFVWGGLAAGLYTISLVIVGQRFKGGDLVAANAALVMLYGLGSVIGPALGGAAMRAAGLDGLPLGMALATAVFLAVAVSRRSWQAGRAARTTGKNS